MNVNVEIDADALQGGITEAVDGALGSAVKSYDVQKAIKEQIADHLLKQIATEAVPKALAAIDIESLTTNLTDILAHSIMVSVEKLLLEAVTTLVYNMRGLSLYGDDADRKRAEIRDELAAAASPTSSTA